MAASSSSSERTQIEHFEDFRQHDWCRELLSDPSTTKMRKRHPTPAESDAPNAFFVQTMFTDDAVRAYLALYRPGNGQRRMYPDNEAVFMEMNELASTRDGMQDAREGARNGTTDLGDKATMTAAAHPDCPEALILVSLGSGLDGGKRRLHGGVTATLLDQAMGLVISYSHQNTSATAELNVKYKKAVTTPAVILCRARITKEAGRWIETKGWIEDGKGTVYAEGTGSFVKSRTNHGSARI